MRDLCLQMAPKDYDLATNALPEQVLSLFQKSFTTGLKHGTVTVIWQDLAVEVTTFRSEGPYSDSRRPDQVVFQSQVEADLARRDFTFNSMAWRPDRGLLDLHGGLRDLLRGRLRCVGDPWVRFDEDALRLLRAIRFSVTYDLLPDAGLVRAAAGLADHLGKLSRERLAAEMMRILAAPYPRRLQCFSGCGLMAETARILLGTAADDHDLCSRLQGMIREELSAEERLPLLLLASSSSGMDRRGLKESLDPFFGGAAGHPARRLLMEKARLSFRLAQSGEAMLYLAWLRLLLPDGTAPGIVCVRRILRLLARQCHLPSRAAVLVAAHAEKLLSVSLGQEDGRHEPFFPDLPDENDPLTLADLAIGGRDLQKMGHKPGPAMRILLERLLSMAIIDPAVNQPDILPRLAK